MHFNIHAFQYPCISCIYDSLLRFLIRSVFLLYYSRTNAWSSFCSHNDLHSELHRKLGVAFNGGLIFRNNVKNKVQSCIPASTGSFGEHNDDAAIDTQFTVSRSTSTRPTNRPLMVHSRTILLAAADNLPASKRRRKLMSITCHLSAESRTVEYSQKKN